MLLTIITEILAWFGGRPINRKAIIDKEDAKKTKTQLIPN